MVRVQAALQQHAGRAIARQGGGGPRGKLLVIRRVHDLKFAGPHAHLGQQGGDAARRAHQHRLDVAGVPRLDGRAQACRAQGIGHRGAQPPGR
ncbi:hypothetical protein G6F68_016004 [Rhizopus microsporus]|nr:hypothetical protein G6F68_016004 [Rhizopus microsporus]